MIAYHIVIAFFFASFILFFVNVLFGYELEKATSLVNNLFVFKSDSSVKFKDKNIKIDSVTRRLIEYPSYGEKFGSIVLSSIDVDLALYHGEDLSILKYGAGHHAGSYFPGEGGTIIIAAHNTYGMLYSLPNVKVGDEVVIKTVYGDFTYKVTGTDIVDASVLGNNLHVSHDKETIMLYTCYPTDTLGYKSKRFVLYGSFVGDSSET